MLPDQESAVSYQLSAVGNQLSAVAAVCGALRLLLAHYAELLRSSPDPEFDSGQSV
jgi:hypothetical protein